MEPRITLITLGVSDLERLAHDVGSPEEVDRTLQESVDAGATLLKPGQKVFWSGDSGYFADPDGFVWEVAWSPYLTVE